MIVLLDARMRQCIHASVPARSCESEICSSPIEHGRTAAPLPRRVEQLAG